MLDDYIMLYCIPIQNYEQAVSVRFFWPIPPSPSEKFYTLYNIKIQRKSKRVYRGKQ